MEKLGWMSLLLSALSFAHCENFVIPKFDCDTFARLPMHIDGKKVEKRGDHFYLDGVKANFSRLTKVDNPTLSSSSGDFGSRIGRISEGGVDWVFLCRDYGDDLKRTRPITKGGIGQNSVTGETCFVESSYGEPEPSNPEFCIKCHNFGSPWIITPFLNQSETGGDGTMDVFPKIRPPIYRIAGLPEAIRKTYQAVEPKLPNGQPDTTCTGCHPIPNENYPDIMASAVGQGVGHSKMTEFGKTKPWMPADSGVKNKQEWQEKFGAAFERLEYCRRNDDLEKCQPRRDLISP